MPDVQGVSQDQQEAARKNLEDVLHRKQESTCSPSRREAREAAGLGSKWRGGAVGGSSWRGSALNLLRMLIPSV